MILIQDGKMDRQRIAPKETPAHCFFEWIYFANVASTLDNRSVYLTRAALGRELARQERQFGRVPLDADTIVRSTTMKTLLRDLRERGGAREVHVRVACPPIVAPCFYGIDMSTMRELFAPRYMKGLQITEAEQDQMAKDLGADSLLYLPVEAIASCIGLEERHLCRACLTAD